MAKPYSEDLRRRVVGAGHDDFPVCEGCSSISPTIDGKYNHLRDLNMARLAECEHDRPRNIFRLQCDLELIEVFFFLLMITSISRSDNASLGETRVYFDYTNSSLREFAANGFGKHVDASLAG